MSEQNLFQKTVRENKLIPEAELTAEPATVEKPKSHFVRNILFGVGAAFIGFHLFGKKAAKAATPKDLDRQFTLEADMKLTTNFVLGEFLVSSEFPELKQYQLSQGELNNVTRLAKTLQQTRDQVGVAIRINSGGRPATLKVRQEGKYKGLDFVQVLTEKGYSPASFSQHMDFSAADFTTSNKESLVKMYLYLVAIGKAKPTPITQAILYIENGVPDFVHLGVISDLNDFTRLGNKFLVAKVTVTYDENNKKKRKTDYFSFTKEKLAELIVTPKTDSLNVVT